MNQANRKNKPPSWPALGTNVAPTDYIVPAARQNHRHVLL